MRVTTDHATSSYGIPVILDDAGAPMDYAGGIKAIRAALGLSTTQLGDLCGVSRRTVEGWESGRMPEVAALNAMGDMLRRARRKGRRPVTPP